MLHKYESQCGSECVCVPLTVKSSGRSSSSASYNTKNSKNNNNTNRKGLTRCKFISFSKRFRQPRAILQLPDNLPSLVRYLISQYGCLYSSHHVHISRKRKGNKNGNLIPFEDISSKLHKTLSS